MEKVISVVRVAMKSKETWAQPNVVLLPTLLGLVAPGLLPRSILSNMSQQQQKRWTGPVRGLDFEKK